MEQNAHGRRPHYHRGRRGPDRRGPDRRAQQPPAEQQAGRDQVDVEQIMREIRARISQQHGIELSNQQIQELAARRLEAILDPRTIKPALLDQLRRGAAAPPDVPAPEPLPAYEFEDHTMFDSPRGLLRFLRRLLNPILRLFFNPTPLIGALNTQARINKELSTRDADATRRQAEWNALHYELLQRVVTEVSRVSLEMQSLALRVESLSAKVDFNDRRVRSMESTAPPPRQAARPEVIVPQAAAAAVPDAPAADAPAAEGGDGPKRRRRRRRGRRSGAPAQETSGGAAEQTQGDIDAGDEGDDGPDDDPEGMIAQADTAVAVPVPSANVAPPAVAPQVTEPVQVVAVAAPADEPQAVPAPAETERDPADR